jgi:hypothetical protein
MVSEQEASSLDIAWDLELQSTDNGEMIADYIDRPESQTSLFCLVLSLLAAVSPDTRVPDPFLQS